MLAFSLKTIAFSDLFNVDARSKRIEMYGSLNEKALVWKGSRNKEKSCLTKEGF